MRVGCIWRTPASSAGAPPPSCTRKRRIAGPVDMPARRRDRLSRGTDAVLGRPEVRRRPWSSSSRRCSSPGRCSRGHRVSRRGAARSAPNRRALPDGEASMGEAVAAAARRQSSGLQLPGGRCRAMDALCHVVVGSPGRPTRRWPRWSRSHRPMAKARRRPRTSSWLALAAGRRALDPRMRALWKPTASHAATDRDHRSTGRRRLRRAHGYPVALKLVSPTSAQDRVGG